MFAPQFAQKSLLKRGSLPSYAQAKTTAQSVLRSISTTAIHRDVSAQHVTSTELNPDPAQLLSANDGSNQNPTPPLIGSARRRAALRSSSSIPFEQLPYQCFQEARKILIEDREEKLHQIQVERERISRLRRQDAAACGGEALKRQRLRSMQKRLDHLKILADINDPMIKKRFEDGEGDMDRPIYRYLADKHWRSYRRLIVMQRLSQMSVVPDLLQSIDLTADVRIAFGRRNVQSGDFVESRVSEHPAKLRVQVFDKGERLVSIVVVDPDVPDVAGEKFDFRCHFVAVNVPISPTTTSVPFTSTTVQERTVLPWLPPWAQKGTPYHRLAFFVLQQPEGEVFDVSALKEKLHRDGFNLRSFIDKYKMRAIGANIFRAKWDEGTPGVMARAGIEGADTEFKRLRTGPTKTPQEPLKKKKNIRGLPSKRV